MDGSAPGPVPPGGEWEPDGEGTGEAGEETGETAGDLGETGEEAGEVGGEESLSGAGVVDEPVLPAEGVFDPDADFPGTLGGVLGVAPGFDACTTRLTRMVAEGGSVTMTRRTVLTPATVGRDTISTSHESPGLSVLPAHVPRLAET
ncbi:hypothetical protein ACWEN3_31605 [Streptomyces sp. NPDC004561]